MRKALWYDHGLQVKQLAGWLDHLKAMVIPEGFAHGFQVIEPASELLYLHTASYRPSAEGALSYKDPKLGILWPLDVTDLSKRDADHPPIDSNFQGLTL